MSATALIVDDNQLNTKLFQALLASRGHRAVAASSGAEALSAIARLRPDIVVLDLMLPDMSGLDLAQLIRQSATLRRVPVLMVTAFPSLLTQRWLEAADVDGFMTKPIAAAAFLAEIDRLLDTAAAPLVSRARGTAGAALAR
jgi:CheY-like chemotaxis protein